MSSKERRKKKGSGTERTVGQARLHILQNNLKIRITTLQHIYSLDFYESVWINQVALYIGDPLPFASIMPKSPGTAPPSTLTTISTSISVPTFGAADPELWFARLDLFFAQQNISDEATKLQLPFTGMSDDVLASFRDFIFNAKGEAKSFTAFKQLCLKRLADSKERRIHQALRSEQLGDRNPQSFFGICTSSWTHPPQTQSFASFS
ncbi:hypothetical protein M514_24378 [Trichuris suis]|uniref:DUF7041 domain-containing protein n=1 Tax=Trichuris suis TaxID=68888 RepID=A0A085N1V6_9BILA|nr:hypothetical protein M514_24378 [Trichuris suis]